MSDNRQQAFVAFATEADALRFGEFTLKSGRISPYFFNSGLFRTGALLARLARFYADAIADSNVPCDMLFGPAYKGIPLVAAVATALAEHRGIDLPYAFNRKEAKDHGEGGDIVGAPLEGRVLIVDDVISAGTSVRESVARIRAAGAEPAGVAIALDRQERGADTDLSAVQQVERDTGIPVIAIARLEDILGFLTQRPEHAAHLDAVRAYRERYGV